MPTIAEAKATVGDQAIRHIVSVSGGKDSAALAVYMRQAYPEIPAEYVFCDTGCELPETYEYLERLENVLDQEIIRLSALDTLKVGRKPGRTAFDIWLNEVYGGFLPNPKTRWCTRVLKIKPFEDYVGEDIAYSYIGIRADEKRDGYKAKKPPVISHQPNIRAVYPFKDDGLTLADIRLLLENSGLGLPDYYRWRSRSGCYFCFYQQIGEWQRLREEHPDLFERARAYERLSGEKRFTWLQGKTLADVAAQDVQEEFPDPEETDGCTICHL